MQGLPAPLRLRFFGQRTARVSKRNSQETLEREFGIRFEGLRKKAQTATGESQRLRKRRLCRDQGSLRPSEPVKRKSRSPTAAAPAAKWQRKPPFDASRDSSFPADGAGDKAANGNRWGRKQQSRRMLRIAPGKRPEATRAARLPSHATSTRSIARGCAAAAPQSTANGLCTMWRRRFQNAGRSQRSKER